ncbi:MAG: DUF86 domain-containing protein [Chloroflexaceae bacterium]|nr:DUF86 domain-containing protein [Chloroflexaceae bacterium]
MKIRLAGNAGSTGEAAKNTPQALREQHPDVAWRGAAQLRDMLVHAYFQISVPTLGKISTSDVPTLRDQVQHILDNRGSSG